MDRVVSTSSETHTVSNVVPAGCKATLAMLYSVYTPLFVHKFTNLSDDLITVHL